MLQRGIKSRYVFACNLLIQAIQCDTFCFSTSITFSTLMRSAPALNRTYHEGSLAAHEKKFHQRNLETTITFLQVWICLPSDITLRFREQVATGFSRRLRLTALADRVKNALHDDSKRASSFYSLAPSILNFHPLI